MQREGGGEKGFAHLATGIPNASHNVEGDQGIRFRGGESHSMVLATSPFSPTNASFLRFSSVASGFPNPISPPPFEQNATIRTLNPMSMIPSSQNAGMTPFLTPTSPMMDKRSASAHFVMVGVEP